MPCSATDLDHCSYKLTSTSASSPYLRTPEPLLRPALSRVHTYRKVQDSSCNTGADWCRKRRTGFGYLHVFRKLLARFENPLHQLYAHPERHKIEHALHLWVDTTIFTIPLRSMDAYHLITAGRECSWVIFAAVRRFVIGEKGGVHVTGLAVQEEAKCWFITFRVWLPGKAATTEQELNPNLPYQWLRVGS